MSSFARATARDRIRLGFEPVKSSVEEFCGRKGVLSSKHYLRGTHRLVEPQETLQSVMPLMPVMGITRVANVTGLDYIGLPVVLVTRPNSRSLAVSQGKGLDLASAKASGLMESIEAFHAERPRVPLRLATLEELIYNANVLNPDSFWQSADQTFHANLQILWTQGTDLLSGRETWVPFDLVHLNFALSRRADSGLPVSSNGLASGNHLLEAISHGICELVERDAVARWEVDPASGSRVDPQTIDDPDCQEILDRFARANLFASIWNVTNDLQIPCFYCKLIDCSATASHSFAFASGSGCHPSRSIALARALTEAAQSRLTFIAGSRDDQTEATYEYLQSRLAFEECDKLRAADVPLHRFNDAPSQTHDDVLADVIWELQQLRNRGCRQVIAVDLTLPEFSIPVVRVIIPGLHARHIFPKEGQSQA